MANLLHTKGSRNRILNSLPTNTFGDDGDIVFCSIKGKGIFLCAKVNGRWSVTDKMQDLTRMGKTSIRDLSVDKLNIKALHTIQLMLPKNHPIYHIQYNQLY